MQDGMKIFKPTAMVCIDDGPIATENVELLLSSLAVADLKDVIRWDYLGGVTGKRANFSELKKT